MILLQNAVIVTSGKEAEGSILIDADRIAGIFWNDSQDSAFRIARLLEQNPETEFLFVGAERGLEKDLVPKAGYAFETVHIFCYLCPRLRRHNSLLHNLNN